MQLLLGYGVTPQQTADLITSSPLAWIDLHNFVNENQRPLEFKQHRFMIDIYADNSPDIVCIKSAQVGFSVYAILKSFHELIYERRNVLYALPTRNIVNDFVVPKVNPLISSNPLINRYIGGDSVSLKKVGERFIFFKGGSEREAISVSADTLVIDEYDRMPDMQVVGMFDTRLQATEAMGIQARRRRFSNGSMVGYGVDALYTDSNQFHWFITCPHCRHDWYIDWEPNGDRNHYVDKQRAEYVCGRCTGIIDSESRRMGRWVAKYPSRARHGYRISQMMAPWVTAQRIIDQQQGPDAMDIATFHGFVLGKAYTPSDMVVNRETILRACAPSTIQKLGVVIGVDQNANEQIWVAGTLQGVFAHGRTKSWEDFERLKLQWNATVVCDPNPYPTMPKAMAEKYNDWYLCYLNKRFDGLSFVDWKGQVVFADRTRLLDTVANEIAGAKLLFREHAYALEDYIADWANIYRTTVEKEDGRVKSEWLKKEGKNSDFSFATAYMRVGLSQQVGGGSTLVAPGSEIGGIVTPMEAGRGSLGSAVDETFAGMGL